MNIALFTNLRAPYRTLQINEYMRDSKKIIDVFYVENFNKNRKWETGIPDFREHELKNKKRINYFKLYKDLKKYDVIIIGGYYRFVYIFLSIVSKIMRKPCILLFDGISVDRIYSKENKLKFLLKQLVIKNSDYILGNGIVSKKYFTEKFNFPKERIFNQYLSVNIDSIMRLNLLQKNEKQALKKSMNIDINKKVIIYSGRLVEIKNVDIILEALNKNSLKDSTHLLIIGGGHLENKIREKCLRYGISLTITGFLSKQEEVFNYYNAGDLFILPSKIEPWGLVVQEAMASGLPIIVSKNSGCVWDFVKEGENGFSFNPSSADDLNEKITKALSNDVIMKKMGEESYNIAKNWTFTRSNEELNRLLLLSQEGEGSK